MAFPKNVSTVEIMAHVQRKKLDLNVNLLDNLPKNYSEAMCVKFILRKQLRPHLK